MTRNPLCVQSCVCRARAHDRTVARAHPHTRGRQSVSRHSVPEYGLRVYGAYRHFSHRTQLTLQSFPPQDSNVQNPSPPKNSNVQNPSDGAVSPNMAFVCTVHLVSCESVSRRIPFASVDSRFAFSRTGRLAAAPCVAPPYAVMAYIVMAYIVMA